MLRLFGLGFGLIAATACGGSDTGNTGGAGGGTTTSTTSTTTTTTSSTTSTTSTTTTSTSTTSSSTITTSSTSTSTFTVPTNCPEITAEMFKTAGSDGTVGIFVGVSSPDQGTATPDDFQLEFYGSGFDPAFDGELTGQFDLTMGGDDNYATCSRCVHLVEDGGGARDFFQVKGSLTIDAASDQVNGTVNATLTDVTLVEVTIDSTTFESTPVAGGACLHLASATVVAAPVPPPPVPAGWTCSDTFYADGDCDCGCGAFDDLDCADMTLASCKFCDDMGSCNTLACDMSPTIDPANNAICTP